MRQIIGAVDTADGGVTFLIDTGFVTVEYEGDGAQRVEVTTPHIEPMVFGAPPVGFTGDWHAQCRAEADRLIAVTDTAVADAIAKLTTRTAAPITVAPAPEPPTITPIASAANINTTGIVSGGTQ